MDEPKGTAEGIASNPVTVSLEEEAVTFSHATARAVLEAASATVAEMEKTPVTEGRHERVAVSAEEHPAGNCA
jgi:hypothetical protein